MYESAARVPFYVVFPGRLDPGGSNATIPGFGVDLMPTFCNAAGIPAPPDMCGEDFLQQYRLRAPAHEPWSPPRPSEGHIRNDRYKLIRYDDDPTVQLFDLTDDPGETHNLAGEMPRRHGAVAARRTIPHTAQALVREAKPLETQTRCLGCHTLTRIQF
ncbi:MAG: hypothetical protein R3C45_12620 [Phycisphaerales bacterium]